jgi:hypothetical protein
MVGGRGKGGQAVGGGHAAGRGWGRRVGLVLQSGDVGQSAPAWSRGVRAGGTRSREAGEVGALMGGPGYSSGRR